MKTSPHLTAKAVAAQQARLARGEPKYSDQEVLLMTYGEREDLGLSERYSVLHKARKKKAEREHITSEHLVVSTFDRETGEQFRTPRNIHPSQAEERKWLLSHSIWAANNGLVVEIMSQSSFEKEAVAE